MPALGHSVERSAQDLEACGDEIVDARSTADVDARLVLGFFPVVAAS